MIKEAKNRMKKPCAWWEQIEQWRSSQCLEYDRESRAD
jgi:acetolactate synthase I/II/III large subunit